MRLIWSFGIKLQDFCFLRISLDRQSRMTAREQKATTKAKRNLTTGLKWVEYLQLPGKRTESQLSQFE